MPNWIRQMRPPSRITSQQTPARTTRRNQRPNVKPETSENDSDLEIFFRQRDSDTKGVV